MSGGTTYSLPAARITVVHSARVDIPHALWGAIDNIRSAARPEQVMTARDARRARHTRFAAGKAGTTASPQNPCAVFSPSGMHAGTCSPRRLLCVGAISSYAYFNFRNRQVDAPSKSPTPGWVGRSSVYLDRQIAPVQPGLERGSLITPSFRDRIPNTRYSAL
jgi:hypothetical protein